MNKFMELAISEAKEGIIKKHGGPFGAVIVRDGIIVGTGHNTVLLDKNATCHGEINAIKEASKKLNTHDLSGCVLYTTGEPCHMCLCACLWANISKVYYGCTIKDNEIIGFRDNKFNELLGGCEKLNDYLECIDREDCLKLFEEYNEIDKETY